MKKRLMTAVLIIALTVCFIPFGTAEASASTYMWAYDGSTCTSNAGAASTINYLMKKYPNLGHYKGTGQCWGYAEKICTALASSRSTKYYSNYRMTKAHFRAKCLGIKAGTHLRLSNSKTFNGGYGHSIALLKVTDNLVCWTDGNYDSRNTIQYYSGTLDTFCNTYGYRYINMVSKPIKYRSFDNPKAYVSSNNEKNAISLGWLKTKGAKSYYIYRSLSKSGKYSKIAATKSLHYYDSDVDFGTKAYYKIKAVRSGSKPYSNITSGLSRLGRPAVTEGTNEEGFIKLS